MARDWLAEKLPAHLEEVREAISDVLQQFDQQYWIDVEDSGRYPQDFVDVLQEGGWLSLLIPEEYGGGGATLAEASVVLEAINRWGGAGTLVHAQLYTMGSVLRFGSEEQKKRWLPQIAAGDVRLQSMGVTEPDAGTDTTRIRARAITTSSTAARSGPHVSCRATSSCSCAVPNVTRTSPRRPTASPSCSSTCARRSRAVRSRSSRSR